MMRNQIFAGVVLLLALGSTARSEPGAAVLIREGSAAASVVVAPDADAVVRRAAEVLNRNLRERSGAALPIISEAEAADQKVVLVLGVIGGQISLADTAPDGADLAPRADGLIIKSVIAGPQRRIYLLGTNRRSVMYAAGRFLRDLTYTGGTVTAPRRDRTESADSPMRGLWFANHQGDTGYEVMSMPQFRTYLEDVMLWGVETVAYAPIDFHNWPAAVFNDPAEFEKHMKRNIVDVPGVIDDYDLRIGVKMFVNNVFAGDIKALGLKKNDIEGGDSSITHLYCPKQGFVCPSDERSRRRLMEIREQLFARLPRVDFFVAHTNDAGGCVCDDCDPYADVYVRLMSEYGRMVQKHHPAAKAGINFYNLTEKGEQSLLKYLAEDGGETVRYVYYGLDPAADSEDLQRLPKHLEAYTFYDVAMWPYWGIYGAMPQITAGNLHLSLERDRRIAEEPNYAGAIPYSEGLHEDITRALYSAWLWDHDVSTERVLDEYCRFYLGTSGRNHADAIDLIRGMDRTTEMHTETRTLFGKVKSDLTKEQLRVKTREACEALKPLTAEQLQRMRRLHESIPAWARDDWRWKTLQVRVLVDHLFTHYPGMPPEQQRARRDEILKLGREIHAQTSYGILRSDRNIEGIDDMYTRLLDQRLERIHAP